MMPAPVDHYWCQYAVIDGAVDHGVRLGVSAGRFVSIDVNTDPEPGATRLAGLTIAGMANAHSHAFQRALRSRTQADRGSFWTWRDLMYRAADRLDPDRYLRLARATFAEMALAGITCVGEFHYVHHQVGGTPYDDPNEMGSALVAAAHDAGIRLTLLDTLYLHGGLTASGYAPPSSAQSRFSDSSADQWAERVSAFCAPSPVAASQHRVGAAIHSVRAVDPTAMRALVEWADEHHAPMHAHVSEQPAENQACVDHFGATPMELLASVGALTPRFTAVHATHLSTTDIDLLAGVASTVAMCPTTERDLGDGIGPTGEFAARQVPMALGSDSHALIDLLEEARAVELNERLRSTRRGVHSAADLLTMATTNGHRCLGWDDAGTIAIGQRADLVTISLDTVRTAGTSPHRAVEAAVFAASAADITNVVVDGRAVVTDGQHVSIDVAGELASSIHELMDS
jgi:formiminoglutamate deiminase